MKSKFVVIIILSTYKLEAVYFSIIKFVNDIPFLTTVYSFLTPYPRFSKKGFAVIEE